MLISSKISDQSVMSATGTVYSNPVDANGLVRASLHIVWTGTPTGTFTLWASNKLKPDASSDSDWVQVTSEWATIANPAGAAGQMLIADQDMAYRWVRLKYVNASGSGAFDAWAQGKNA